MTISIYDAAQSGHCHRVRLAASLMGVTLETISISTLEGGRTGEQYLAVNPLGQIPAIDDDGFILTDSIAIINYLAKNYAEDKGWIPEDSKGHANMLRWFGVASGPIYNGPNFARLIKLFGVERDYELAQVASVKLFKMMEKEVQDRQWLVGDRETLADIACYSYLAVAHEGELDLSAYNNINRWLADMRNLSGFVEMTFSK